jgi:RNA polymerase subunit RPABC4/transcription elongation factor Spt4
MIKWFRGIFFMYACINCEYEKEADDRPNCPRCDKPMAFVFLYNDELVLGSKELAIARGVHQRTVGKWFHRGLSYIQIGPSHFLIRLEDARNFRPGQKGRPKKPNSQEAIAKELGISQSMVSYALTGARKVSDEVKESILARYTT